MFVVVTTFYTLVRILSILFSGVALIIIICPPLCKGRWQPEAVDGGIVKITFHNKNNPSVSSAETQACRPLCLLRRRLPILWGATLKREALVTLYTSVGETCGLPWATAVRPYRMTRKALAYRKKTAGASPRPTCKKYAILRSAVVLQ